MTREQEENLVARNQSLIKENMNLRAQLQSLQHQIKNNPMRFFIVRDWHYGDDGKLYFNEEVLLEAELL